MRALLAALLLAACGSGDGEVNGGATENQIERLSSPRDEKQDPSLTARPQPIEMADIEREGMLGAGCDFSSEERMLLVTDSEIGLVRIEGRLRRLAAAGPVGETGGFFRGGDVTVSVGRTSEVATPLDEGASWPARITVTNRRTGAQHDRRGVWSCGA